MLILAGMVLGISVVSPPYDSDTLLQLIVAIVVILTNWGVEKNKARVQARVQVRDQAWDQVLDQVWDQVRNPVWSQAGNQVWDQLKNKEEEKNI